MPKDELIAALEKATDEEMPTAIIAAYLREYSDEMHHTAAARLEAYEHVILTALRATERGEAGR